jgi:hypothetical protein
MTEAEWLACNAIRPILEFLGESPGSRKLRLIACVCCRSVWDQLNERSQDAIMQGEQFADGMIDKQTLLRAGNAARSSSKSVGHTAKAARCCAYGDAYLAALFATDQVVQCCTNNIADLAALVRDIFGNPFRPVTIDPSWLAWNDGTVVKLAQGIYDDRTFDCLPILADALEEAGCDKADILTHCRQPGEHMRGCWVVDLLLGKE